MIQTFVSIHHLYFSALLLEYLAHVFLYMLPTDLHGISHPSMSVAIFANMLTGLCLMLYYIFSNRW